MCDDEQVWKRGGHACSKCNFSYGIPLKPRDSKTKTYYNLLCPRCHYTWTLDKPTIE